MMRGIRLALVTVHIPLPQGVPPFGPLLVTVTTLGDARARQGREGRRDSVESRHDWAGEGSSRLPDCRLLPEAGSTTRNRPF